MSQHKKLSDLYAKTLRKREAMQEITLAKAKYDELVRLEMQYSRACTSESDDVEKLDKASLVNLFYSIMGKMDDKRQKEVSEAAEAQARYDAVLAESKAVTDEIDSLKYELRTLGNCDLDFEALRNEMVAALAASDAESAPQAELLLQKMNQAGADAEELAFVINVGKAARATAVDLHEELYKAQRLAHEFGTISRAHGIIWGEVTRHMENQEYMRAGQEKFARLKRQLDLYRTPLYDLPRFGSLKTIEDILCGRTWGGTIPIDSGVTEMEKLIETIDTYAVKLEKLKERRLEVRARLDQELTELLLSSALLDGKESNT